MAIFTKKPNLIKPKILKEQISNERQITIEPQILKEHQKSKETQITNKPQILKYRKIFK